MDANILETTLVTKIYSSSGLSVRAVDDVSIKVRSGEFVALVGPSGSGKTTMLAILAALLKPTKGQVYINGNPLASLNDSQRTRFRRENIGFTFQENNLIPYLTALENVDLMQRLNKKKSRGHRHRASELLIRLGLEKQMTQLPAQLSTGQQQRVAIARSLVHEPSVVLADEPTANLDTERANQVVRIFADLIHEEKHAGIMVTHDLRMCQYVDKVIQMVDGKISRAISDQEDINLLARTSEFDILDLPASEESRT